MTDSDNKANWFAAIIVLIVAFGVSFAYLHETFVTKNEYVSPVINKGKKVYSCPDRMPDQCHAASICQSMCVGQIQVENKQCVTRTVSGSPRTEQCEFVGYLISENPKD